MGPLLITAGRVYDGVTERALEQAYVVVDGDVITAVGPQTDLEGHMSPCRSCPGATVWSAQTLRITYHHKAEQNGSQRACTGSTLTLLMLYDWKTRIWFDGHP